MRAEIVESAHVAVVTLIALVFTIYRVSNMKNELSRNFQQTIVLTAKYAVRFAFDSLLE